MKNEFLLLMIILIPISGALILPLAGKISVRFRNILALTFVAVTFIFSVEALRRFLTEGSPLSFRIPLKVDSLDLSFGLYGDGLAIFMAMASTLIGTAIVLYSLGYMKHYGNQNEYYLMVVLFIGAMMGIVFSTSLIFIYLFWEISAICCWRLIGFFRKAEHILRADKAFLVTAGGALVMLAGFVTVYLQTGTFDLTQMKGAVISNTSVVLILFGILSKSATLPFHTWLPDAGVAPSPVTSLLHAAVLVKIGVYVFARLFIINFDIAEIWHTAVPAVAGASTLVSAGAALLENDLKRIIAYSTVSQIGFIFLGLSTGNKLAAAGGLLYILMHGLAKGGLFLCAGIVEQSLHTKDIRQMGGLMSRMPVTGISFLVCAFSVMGIPPFGGFFSKFMVIGGAVDAGHPWIALTFIIGAVMTVIYLLRVFARVFLGGLGAVQSGISSPVGKGGEEGSPTMLVSVASLAVLSLIGGILVYYPATFVETIVNQAGVMLR